MPKILIIEDDTAFRQMLHTFLARYNFEVISSGSIGEAEKALKETYFDIILSDVRLPKGDGISFLADIKARFPETQVILMTGYAEVKTAVEAMKKGAFDYISKPFSPENMLKVINGALQKGASQESHFTEKNSNVLPPAKIQVKDPVYGSSEAAKKWKQYLELVAPTDMSVLITGESGTGKEVTAKAIHDKSGRVHQNFVAVDCGAIPKELATSEFFGHTKGSFTGAVENKTGHFETANGGTLFLDEIGNLSYENQVLLLRALQERRIKPVGSTKEILVDVRIVSATNENLLDAVKRGSFREDLYHRLNEFLVEVPALKNRAEDLRLFADYFLDRANQELDKKVKGFSEDVLHTFQKYTWPGNIRELKNVVKRAVLFTTEDTIKMEAIVGSIGGSIAQENNSKFSKSSYEKERILSALKQTNFNKTKAAKLLQITRKTLYNKINQYQLEV